MSLLPLERKPPNAYFYPPRYRIKVDEQDLSALGVEINAVSVSEVLDGASRASFFVGNGDLRWLSSPLFKPGARVTVWMGYADPLEQLFIGEITELRPTFPEADISLLEVVAYDFSHRMSRGCRFRSWENMTDSEIARKIAQENELKPSGVQDT